MSNIIDISEWQVPGAINYDALASQLSHAIVRVQYGSNYEDKHYKTHITELQKRNVPVAVYAWIRGVSIADMEKEATDFYNRAKQFNPTFWWIDVEEQSMGDMRAGANAFKNKLKALGANKVGAYIANHLYSQFNIDVAQFDAVWIPAYGKDTGAFNGTIPSYPCDLHQYTQNGRLNGYSSNLDMNRLTGSKALEWFTGVTTTPSQNDSTYPLGSVIVPKNLGGMSYYVVDKGPLGYVMATGVRWEDSSKFTTDKSKVRVGSIVQLKDSKFSHYVASMRSYSDGRTEYLIATQTKDIAFDAVK